MAQDPLNGLNVCAVFRFALGYPDEQRLEFFRDFSPETPETLEDLCALYLALFEAGVPHPCCPLVENHYVANRPAGEIVLENKLFYKHFGLELDSRAAPDHLLTQLEFLSWLDHAIAAGNSDPESIANARRDFLARHVSHWLPRAVVLARKSGGGCYAGLLAALAARIAVT